MDITEKLHKEAADVPLAVGAIMQDAADEIERLRAENAALKYSLQLDEDLIGKIQQIISILASRPVWTPNA